MVSEETSVLVKPSTTIYNKSSNQNNRDKEIWLSGGGINNNVDNRDENSNIRDGNDNVSGFVRDLLLEICDKVVVKCNTSVKSDELVVLKPSEVMTRDRSISVDERSMRKAHRRASIIENELYDNYMQPPPSRHLDENDNDYGYCEAVNPVLGQIPKKTVRKKLSFRNLFPRKPKVRDHHHDHNIVGDHPEAYDDFDPNEDVSILRSKKYASAMELNQKASTLTRTSSFFKKLAHIGEGSKNLLKRSMSVRDVGKRRDKEREKLSVIKKQEWKQSLQSLVENDVHVSYNDLSFVDYDVMNDINYGESFLRNKESGPIARTQSLIVKRSPEFIRPIYKRGTSSPNDVQSNSYLTEQTGALSLPSLHHLNHENGENLSENSPTQHRYRRRPQSVNSEDGNRPRTQTESSFRSASGGCSKLKRQNACRQKTREAASVIVENRRHTTDPTIARETLTIDREPSPTSEGQHQEWRKFVGSIRRKVQRHASSSNTAEPSPSNQTVRESLSRKNSLTQNLFKRSSDNNENKKSQQQQKQLLTKQKSIDADNKTDLFKSLTFKDKSKSVSVKHIDTLQAPKMGEPQKGVRKSDKSKDSSDKTLKSSINLTKGKSGSGGSGGHTKSKEHKGLKQDDFLKATMRIFLVVSPPAGKLQVRSRSLNHLDTLEMRQGVVSTTDPALKDSRSEPDCTRPLLAPPTVTPEPPTPTTETPPARKHMLSRSQKSSSECFSVNFEVGDESTWDNEFFIAQRGITLYDALAKLCELRNIDLSNCDARLQDRENNVETFLLFSQDTGSLVGKHIRITAKESSNKKLSGSLYGNHSRKQSGSYRPRTSSFFSSSTEEPAPVASSTLSLHDSDQNKKQIKQRLTAFFGNSKDTKYEALIDQLDKYSKQGIPNNLSYPQGQCESVDALYKLEDDWREIVDFTELNEKQQQQQTALWELITSEVSYIRTLKVVTDLFLACLKDLQSHHLLKEIDREKLFSNITEILDSNVMFWRNTLFPLIRDMRKLRQTTCIENMADGFRTIHEMFQPYYKYCAEQARCQHYCRENMDSEVFTAYLTWCESQKECNRLRLMDILVQPMQRLTKYGLLLKAILRHTEEDVERESLQIMIKTVDDFVINVNSSLKHRQDKERLKGIIARIESYDIVESKDDDIEKILKKEKCYTQLDLTRPMLNCPPERKRHLLLEGDLKLKDSNTSKMEVHCFLLTDMLLICKPSTKKGGATMRVIRQPYLVDRLVVSELHRETPSLAVIYKNEFDMAVAAFILQNNDAKKLKGWKDGIAKAQTLYAQAKQMSFVPDESLDVDYSLDCNLETDYHSLQLAPRSPIATSSRASRVSSLAHSHSGSVEMNDQSSIGSTKDQSRGVSIENENRTGSISSDEGVQPLPPDKSPVSQKNSFKNRFFSKTPNTLSVQPFSSSLGQSLPNLTLGSPNVGSLSLSLNQNTLSVPNSKNGSHLLSPTHRGISYPPPSPTRGNLRRGLAISQSKNPPLIKTRHVNSTTAASQQVPASFDFDVPVIAGVSQSEDQCESFSRGHHRQAMKRIYRNDKRYHTAGVVDDIKINLLQMNTINGSLSGEPYYTCIPNGDSTVNNGYTSTSALSLLGIQGLANGAEIRITRALLFKFKRSQLNTSITKSDNRDATIHKRLSWNCSSQDQRPPNEDHT